MTEPTADRAWELLTAGHPPAEVVRRLTPATADEAARLARRLPLLADRPAADRGAALARLAARAGMRRFGLALTARGEVAGPTRPAPGPSARFPGDGCSVEYTPRYFPDTDHFRFTGPGDPPGPHPLSVTGHWSHFADPDAVLALGGPEAYAAALSAAGRDGARAFEAGLAGPDPSPGRPAVGPHTAALLQPAPVRPAGVPTPPPPAGGPPDLFSELPPGPARG